MRLTASFDKVAIGMMSAPMRTRTSRDCKVRFVVSAANGRILLIVTPMLAVFSSVRPSSPAPNVQDTARSR